VRRYPLPDQARFLRECGHSTIVPGACSKPPFENAKTKGAVLSGLWNGRLPHQYPLLASIKLVCDKGPTRPSRANVDELKTGFEILPLTFTNNKVHMSRLLCSSLQPMPSPSRWTIRVPDKSPELSCESDNQMDVQLRVLVCRLQSPFVVPVLVIYN
jgi:hypothetical protein